jgi:hypothetical protein
MMNFILFALKCQNGSLFLQTEILVEKIENFVFIHWYALFHAFIIECIQNSICKYITMM